MPKVYISIGSNIEPAKHIRIGVECLRREFGEVALSPVYESEAVGFAGDNFYNLVAAFETERDVYRVNRALRQIEDDNGRQRGPDKFAPRTLDMDLILYGDLCIKESGLSLPRDEILKYAFVLRPLADIAGGEKHPQTGQRYAELWAAFDDKAQALWPVQVW